MDNKLTEWNRSYQNRDNFVFYPHEEVIRFVSRHLRKRTGLEQFTNIVPEPAKLNVLDLGCGIGRHVIYCHEMGLNAYGADLSNEAVRVAVTWAERRGMSGAERKIVQADIRSLPWDDGFFQVAVSHGVLDSMSFEIARAACVELVRVMAPDGLFYCDLVSGDDSKHAREFCGEEVVETRHEEGTIQSYFNLAKIHRLFDGLFEIVECILIRREEVIAGGYSSRYHLVLRRA